ncbi:hypothetical protein K490DRAFT_74529 [Saccharata proteae CBS 121410]|uniref:Nucleoporin Pom152 n=1 Tax=Saccharata proteae CBS 121410 TaxID=1314787 RepID=A0A9P4HTR7_9PEZI|nr:hypothetical protein K490DRAFT_74529 [Saccharata proteae CBS 121410]
MNGTPRLRSGAFPQTPETAPRSNRTRRHDTPQGTPRVATVLPDLPSAAPAGGSSNPLIPVDVIDEPSQRLYVVTFYIALLAWRSIDWWTLQTTETESWSLLLKWIVIDGAFMFGLPALKIPWLEWSLPTMTLLFFIHCLFDFMTMLRIPIPILTWFLGLFKFMYDKEVAIGETREDAWKVLHNESLILGKQIVHILPEGSALLNPEKTPFCLDGPKASIQLPIQINQTEPVLIELLRIDLDTMQNETISISKSAAEKLRKTAMKKGHYHSDDPLVLEYPVKKTGLYILNKVIDKSNLEVQTRGSNVMVVSCPFAHIKPSKPARCKGEQANIGLVVEGTPPLHIKYRRMVNGEKRESKHQSLQPDDFVSPLARHQPSEAMVRSGDWDLSWARSHQVNLPLNDALAQSGIWTYSVDEVSDGLGNVMHYAKPADESDALKLDDKIQRAFFVHERPSAVLQGCDSQHPIQVAKGQVAILPIRYSSTKNQPLSDSPHTVEYYFTPEGELGPNGEHGGSVQIKHQAIKNTGQKLLIKESGLYTLKGVATDVCDGDVQEPASCLLLNPPEPDISIKPEPIFDKCKNNPIGLRVDLDLIGTPPFMVTYTQRKKGGGERQIHEKVSGLRGQIEIFPPKEGHYTYTFTEISDQVYQAHSLKHKEGLVLEQDVKPSASASFIETPRREACIDEPLKFAVKMQGEGPWELEYELVHAGKREKFGPLKIHTESHWISTDKLRNGGEYTLALASVTDKLGCTVFLKEEVKIGVRHERPKAYFGQVEGKRSLRTLEGKDVSLPIKLTGKAPWTIRYQNVDKADGEVLTGRASHANDYLRIADKGLYELLDVTDAICPGTIDEKANQFEVSLIPRPRIAVRDTSTVTREGDRYFKQDICEGETDNVDLILSGSPPYNVKYEERHFPASGAKSLRRKELNAAMSIANIAMDTSRAGLCEYEFNELSDNNYDHDRKSFTPITIEQRVHPRPSAAFNNPGKTYSYCTTEADGEEVIPITFTGVPPFYLEVDLKHHGASKPETLSFPNIPSNKHSIKIPHRNLHLGSSSLTIRKVRDSRGCRNKPDLAPGTAPRVLIAVHNAPSIAPLDQRGDFCVGDRLSYSLSGVFPFEVHYTFNGVARKATTQGTTFRRLAEKPGLFTITGVTDSASQCRAPTELTASIHQMPQVRVSKGKVSRVDIHEGGEAEILFEFGGTPPFEFTYTRSTNEDRARGIRSQVLETRTLVSSEFSMRIKASEEGTYEVVSIRDHWCAFSKNEGPKPVKGGQKALQY